MKKIQGLGVIILSWMLIFGFAAAAAFAQTEAEQQQAGATAQQPHDITGFIRASELMDMTVRNQQGEELGDVKDFVLNNGQIRFIVVSKTGLLGVGENLVPIPFQTVSSADMEDDTLIVRNLDEEKFDNAPTFEAQEWDQLRNPSFEGQVFGYYGEQPPQQQQMQQGQQPPMQQPGQQQQEMEQQRQQPMEQPAPVPETQQPVPGAEEPQPDTGTGEIESGAGTSGTGGATGSGTGSGGTGTGTGGGGSTSGGAGGGM